MLNQTNLTRADLNLLTLFEAVFEERHVARAADRLHLSPSAVSHGLGRLRRLFNDPLFLRTPKGVVPTERALALSEPIFEALTRVRSILSSVEPFDPSTSSRRFTIMAPDGVTAVILPPLLALLRHSAPTVDIAIRQLLPLPAETVPERAWSPAFADLESRSADLAIVPYRCAPERFEQRPLYLDDFVLVMRGKRGSRARRIGLDDYCRMAHVVVSLGGDARGFVDDELAALGRSRRVALTVPNFLLALAMVADGDLIAAVPRRFAAVEAPRFGLSICEPPMPIGKSDLHAVMMKSAMRDEGVAWLVGAIEQACQGSL